MPFSPHGYSSAGHPLSNAYAPALWSNVLMKLGRFHVSECISLVRTISPIIFLLSWQRTPFYKFAKVRLFAWQLALLTLE